MNLPRPIVGVVDAVRTLEGEGFEVNRPFPTAHIDMLDPFLLLDEMGPTDHQPGSARGAPDHPHRGFETVTYLLEGEFEHADSVGNRGVITAGSVQWMTAGAGVVHSEMPSSAVLEQGGRVHGFQLWVNLPAAAKMAHPRYQRLDAEAIPQVEAEGSVVRVISGAYRGTTGPGETHSPITYLHASLEGGASISFEPAPDENVGVFVFDGAATVNGHETGTGRLAVSTPAEGVVAIEAIDDTEVLVMAGRPLGEPVARYGPFVMNTREEILTAIEDFQAGRMGTIAPHGSA